MTSFSHFPPNYQKVSHERTIKSNLHSRIAQKKGGTERILWCRKFCEREKKSTKGTDNFSAQKNSDKREIKCQNHLSTLHPLFKKDFLVAELMGKVGRRKSYVFKRIWWTLPSILKLVGTPGTSKSIGENCQCANSKKRRHLLTKTRRQRKSRKTASKVRLCKSYWKIPSLINGGGRFPKEIIHCIILTIFFLAFLQPHTHIVLLLQSYI